MKGYIPSVNELNHFLVYEPGSGEFIWKFRPSCLFKTEGDANKWNARNAGRVAGNKNKGGYIQIRLNGYGYLAHRLAALYMQGVYPTQEIDHINHNPSDNSWGNLRHANRVENGKNQSLHSTNSSGVIGVYWNKKSQKWHAQMTSDGRRIHLGHYSSLEDARAARKSAEMAEGFHPNHGAAA